MYNNEFLVLDSVETFDLVIQFYGWDSLEDFTKDTGVTFEDVKGWYFDLSLEQLEDDASTFDLPQEAVDKAKAIPRLSKKDLVYDNPVFFVCGNPSRVYAEDLRDYIDSYLTDVDD